MLETKVVHGRVASEPEVGTALPLIQLKLLQIQHAKYNFPNIILKLSSLQYQFKKFAHQRDLNANLSDVSSNYAGSLSLDVGRSAENMSSPKLSSVLAIPAGLASVSN